MIKGKYYIIRHHPMLGFCMRIPGLIVFDGAIFLFGRLIRHSKNRRKLLKLTGTTTGRLSYKTPVKSNGPHSYRIEG